MSDSSVEILRVTDKGFSQFAHGLENVLKKFAVLLAIVVTFISLGYAFLAYPQADDLERTGALRVFTPLERIRSDYLAIDGRWASKWVEYSVYRGGHVIEYYPP